MENLENKNVETSMVDSTQNKENTTKKEVATTETNERTFTQEDINKTKECCKNDILKMEVHRWKRKLASLWVLLFLKRKTSHFREACFFLPPIII